MSKGLFNSKPIHISQVDSLECNLETFFHLLGLKREEWCFVGSIGKKEFSNDVDVAVKFDRDGEFEEWVQLFRDLNLEIKTSKGFNLISVGYQFESRTIQLDLFLTKDLSWTKYMLYSPNLSTGESKFGGIYRNLLMMATSISETKTFIDEYTWEQDQIELFTGWYRVKKTVKSKDGKILKNPRILERCLLATDPYFIFSSLGLEKVYTFEDLLFQVKNKQRFKEIKYKFEEYCKNLNLELPKYE